MDWIGALATAALATALALLCHLAARAIFADSRLADGVGVGATLLVPVSTPLPADISWCPVCNRLSVSGAGRCGCCGVCTQLLVDDLFLGGSCALAHESLAGRHWGRHTYRGYMPVADRLLVALGGGFPFEEIAGRLLLDEEARS